MSNEAERMHILQMIEDGKITAEEGMRLLNALLGKTAEASAEAAPQASPKPDPSPRTVQPNVSLEHWKRWPRSVIPMWIGVGLTTLSALWMYGAFRSGGFGLWFACATLPFVLGVVVMALAAGSRTAKWIHIRVKTGEEEWPRNIALSFPLPISLTAWFLRTFRNRIPNLKDTAVDELILALGESTSAETPLYIEVMEGEGGEQVQVYIG
jgi:hypothetical protein